MRIYNILKNIIITLKSWFTMKQNKDWRYLGSTKGTLSYDISLYTELNVIVSFGGVKICTHVPALVINETETLFVGAYGSNIYVEITSTSMKMRVQPSGYTASITLYAR